MSYDRVAADHLLFRCYLALLFWAPLPFGSNRPWGLALLFLGGACLLLWWLALVLLGKLSPSGLLRRELGLPLLLLLAVQAGVFLQTVPLPREWIELLSPRAASLHIAQGPLTLSLDPALTSFQLLQGLTCTVGFALTGVLANRRERVRLLLWTLVGSGAVQAIYGTMMIITGLEYGFFVEKYSGEGVVTGTFVNRNHTAGYLVMTLACGIGLLISQLEGGMPAGARAWLRELAGLLLGTKFRLRLLLALMVIGLILTRSRMGNLSFFVSLTVAGGIVVLSGRRLLTRPVAILLASLLVVDLVIVGQWFGADQLAERLIQTSAQEETRDDVAGYSLGIVRDYPWTGSGAGTFYTVFPHYSQVALSGDFYSHAHNDYVEIAGDLGLPLFGLLVILMLATAWQAFRLQANSDSRMDQGCGFTVLMVLGWAACHSLADFNLYIPANALTLAALLPLAWIRRGVREEKWEKFP